MMAPRLVWPAVDVAAWAATKKSFHLYAQMLGKMRVALSPAQPNWMFTALHLTAHGLTTSPMPWEGTSVQATIDVFRSEIIVERSTGASERIALLPVRTVAEIYGAFRAAIAALGVQCEITPMPQELADVTPLPDDHRPAAYDPAAVQRWHAAATATVTVLDEWRAHFFGRTGIAVWWGALDVSLMLFNGKHVTPPADRGYLLKYDLDAELMNVGLYYGDETNPPTFYGYMHPQPPNVEHLPIAPAAAAWFAKLGEWVLPYDVVRNAADPAAELRAFLDAIYENCVAGGGWDRKTLSYAEPPRGRRATR